MIKFTRALEAWGTPDFENVLRDEIKTIERELLPLQEGLSQTNYVCDTDISVLLLNTTETIYDIVVKTGIFYAGMNAGSCCADDPTPVCEQTEYCEVQFKIRKKTAETTAVLMKD